MYFLIVLHKASFNCLCSMSGRTERPCDNAENIYL